MKRVDRIMDVAIAAAVGIIVGALLAMLIRGCVPGGAAVCPPAQPPAGIDENAGPTPSTVADVGPALPRAGRCGVGQAGISLSVPTELRRFALAGARQRARPVSPEGHDNPATYPSLGLDETMGGCGFHKENTKCESATSVVVRWTTLVLENTGAQIDRIGGCDLNTSVLSVRQSGIVFITSNVRACVAEKTSALKIPNGLRFGQQLPRLFTMDCYSNNPVRFVVIPAPDRTILITGNQWQFAGCAGNTIVLCIGNTTALSCADEGQPPTFFSDDHFVGVNKMVRVQTFANRTGDYKLAPAGRGTEGRAAPVPPMPCTQDSSRDGCVHGPGGRLAENRTGRAADKPSPNMPSATRTRGADEKPAQARLARFRVTAYCPCARCCGKKPSDPAYGITASGTKADHPLVAAPPEFPFGTVMTIPGYGRVKVEDRGGAIKGDRLDVFFDDHESAIQWGVQHLNVEVVGR